MVLEKIKRTIRRYHLLERGDRVVVAVSGGPDSVCLLSVLHVLAKDLDLALHVAHLDHRFRGAESAAEADFVRELAGRFTVPATVEAIDVPAYCRDRGLSSQAGAREVRYAFLNRVAASFGAGKIALGHTANDQAETVLMRFIRGAGMSALAAIPPLRDNIIRPLLDATRREIMAYLRESGLTFVTDPSNERPVYTRNRVRLEVLPVLEGLNPRAVEALAAGATLLRDESAAVEELVGPLITGLLRVEEESVRFDRGKTLSLLPAVRRRALRTAVTMLAADVDLALLQTDEALAFLEEAQTGRALELPGGLVLERSYEDFVVRPRPGPGEFSVPLAVPGTAVVPRLSLSVDAEVIDPASPPLRGANYLWQADFDYAKIALPLALRSRREGDRFCPAGMGGKSKKLQDYFVDEKVPRGSRASVPLLASDQDVLWVVGMRTDERFLPGSATKKVLRITVRSSDERRDG